MIQYIAVHHAGGFSSQSLGSSRHLTVDAINNAHKNRPDWIGYPAHLSSLGYYVGYNFVYDPKDRSFTQTRAIGEETLAQVGYNFSAISICIIGNYSSRIVDKKPVDPMTPEMESDIATFINKLISNPYNYIVKNGTVIKLSVANVHPHRWYQPTTECYGTGLSDTWINQLLAKYSYNPSTEMLEKRLKLTQMVLSLMLQLKALTASKKPLRGVYEGCACNGKINT